MREFQPESQYNFAGFWRRSAAGIIDFVILSILPAVWIGVAFVVFGSPIQISEVGAFSLSGQAQEISVSHEESQFNQQQRIAGWASNIFGAVFVIGFWTWKGQTPGKMLFKMRIIKNDPVATGAVAKVIGSGVGGSVSGGPIFFTIVKESRVPPSVPMCS